MNPVTLCTIHHEGAGTPSDVPRGKDGGYTFWIGLSRWEWLRDVWESYATLGYNHRSLDICLSGNRMTSLVTDADIQLIRGAFMDARARGYVVASPEVRAHKNSPGSSTVCPGVNTMARWADVVNACRDVPVPAPAPKPPKPAPWKVQPMHNPPIVLAPCVADLACPTGGAWTLHADGGVAAWGGAPFHGSPHGQPLSPGEQWADLRAPKKPGEGPHYVALTTAGDTYNF